MKRFYFRIVTDKVNKYFVPLSSLQFVNYTDDSNGVVEVCMSFSGFTSCIKFRIYNEESLHRLLTFCSDENVDSKNKDSLSIGQVEWNV